MAQRMHRKGKGSIRSSFFVSCFWIFAWNAVRMSLALTMKPCDTWD